MSFFGNLAPILGGGLGFMVGGPFGAAAGAGLGSAVAGKDLEDVAINSALAGAGGFGANALSGALATGGAAGAAGGAAPGAATLAPQAGSTFGGSAGGGQPGLFAQGIPPAASTPSPVQALGGFSNAPITAPTTGSGAPAGPGTLDSISQTPQKLLAPTLLATSLGGSLFGAGGQQSAPPRVNFPSVGGSSGSVPIVANQFIPGAQDALLQRRQRLGLFG